MTQRHFIPAPGDPLRHWVASLQAGSERFPEGAETLSPAPLTSLALAGTRAGRARLYGRDFRIEHRPRTLVVMAPQPGFREVAGPGVWDTHWMILHGRLAGAWLAGLTLAPPSVALAEVPLREAHALAEATRLVLEQPLDWQWRWLSLVAQVLDYARRELSAGGTGLEARARRLMLDTLDAPLALPELARRLNVSPSLLSHEFRRRTGAPPMRVYRELRMHRARELLAGGASVAETSELLGFSNPFHFSRVFKRTVGTTPSGVGTPATQAPLRAVQPDRRSGSSRPRASERGNTIRFGDAAQPVVAAVPRRRKTRSRK